MPRAGSRLTTLGGYLDKPKIQACMEDLIQKIPDKIEEKIRQAWFLQEVVDRLMPKLNVILNIILNPTVRGKVSQRRGARNRKQSAENISAYDPQMVKGVTDDSKRFITLTRSIDDEMSISAHYEGLPKEGAAKFEPREETQLMKPYDYFSLLEICELCIWYTGIEVNTEPASASVFAFERKCNDSFNRLLMQDVYIRTLSHL